MMKGEDIVGRYAGGQRRHDCEEGWSFIPWPLVNETCGLVWFSCVT